MPSHRCNVAHDPGDPATGPLLELYMATYQALFMGFLVTRWCGARWERARKRPYARHTAHVSLARMLHKRWHL